MELERPERFKEERHLPELEEFDDPTPAELDLLEMKAERHLNAMYEEMTPREYFVRSLNYRLPHEIMKQPYGKELYPPVSKSWADRFKSGELLDMAQYGTEVMTFHISPENFQMMKKCTKKKLVDSFFILMGWDFSKTEAGLETGLVNVPKDKLLCWGLDAFPNIRDSAVKIEIEIKDYEIKEPTLIPFHLSLGSQPFQYNLQNQGYDVTVYCNKSTGDFTVALWIGSGGMNYVWGFDWDSMNCFKKSSDKRKEIIKEVQTEINKNWKPMGGIL